MIGFLFSFLSFWLLSSFSVRLFSSPSSSHSMPKPFTSPVSSAAFLPQSRTLARVSWSLSHVRWITASLKRRSQNVLSLSTRNYSPESPFCGLRCRCPRTEEWGHYSCFSTFAVKQDSDSTSLSWFVPLSHFDTRCVTVFRSQPSHNLFFAKKVVILYSYII